MNDDNDKKNFFFLQLPARSQVVRLFKIKKNLNQFKKKLQKKIKLIFHLNLFS